MPFTWLSLLELNLTISLPVSNRPQREKAEQRSLQQLQQSHQTRDQHKRVAADQLLPGPQCHHQRGRQKPGHYHQCLVADGKYILPARIML